MPLKTFTQKGAPMAPFRSLAWSTPLLLANIAIAFGQRVGDPAAGKRLAEATCQECHGAQNTSYEAPAFSAIAAMPSTTVQSLDVFLSSTLPIFARLFQTAAQKIDASATRRTACSAGNAVRPKGPNGAHRSVRNDQ